jgi:hypothetical protein
VKEKTFSSTKSENCQTWVIFFIQLSTQSTRIGFTVEDSKAFVEAVESKGIRIEKS